LGGWGVKGKMKERGKLIPGIIQQFVAKDALREEFLFTDIKHRQ
jgi:hypothetical protein